MCKVLVDLYENLTGHKPDNISPLTGSGSNRQYFRLSGEPTLIGVIGESIPENNAFIKLATRFLDRGISVPKVVAIAADSSAYLQEDLGHTSLFDMIASGRATGNFSPEEIRLLEKTVSHLPDIQFRGAIDLNYDICYPLSEFNRRTVMWDLNYFKYCFLKTYGIDFNESRLEDDFERLADKLLDGNWDTFMYRDFQSRNVMINHGEPYFIDFQGGRKGPVHYDVASFLWQAKANFPEELRKRLIDKYIESASRFTDIDAAEFMLRLRHFVLFRLLQVLGAYGFRGRFERKLHFLESIPPALKNIESLLKVPFEEYPALTDILSRIIDKEKKTAFNRDSLLVTVESFSYKRGIPEDLSGNGGGFVFDCRAMHNPGRYERYQSLTGRDTDVIKFLEEQGQVQPFLENCYGLTDAAVETYMRRGFTSLCIFFGCTGGQHRSVYCAEAMALHINKIFGVEVNLIHREQNINQTLPPLCRE